MLSARGVPFTEKTVTSNEDVEALKRLAGASSVPFLTIGGQQLKGFSEVEWSQFLDAADYPKTSQLPASYRQPPATPLVAAQQPQAPVRAPAGTGRGTRAPRPPLQPPRKIRPASGSDQNTSVLTPPRRAQQAHGGFLVREHAHGDDAGPLVDLALEAQRIGRSAGPSRPGCAGRCRSPAAGRP